MYILRSANLNDLEDLYELSQLMLFINLPPDKEIIKSKIESSIRSFTKPSRKLWENYYLFVLEDSKAQRIIGASMIHAQHGTEDEPHYFFTVSQENKFSKTLNTGFIHGTLKLGLDTNGPTEIGGLILDPEFRKSDKRLGKQLSFVRFLYMGMHPDRFKETIHSELMPPFDNEGHAPLWEAIGRRFLNLEYHEADVLSRSNKEFILNLFPADTIYMTLLPIEARNAIGKVGESTAPVKKMLEGIGFKYTNEVDPFDGGPHYRAKLKEIAPVKDLFEVEILIREKIIKSDLDSILASIPSNDGSFKASVISGNLNKGTPPKFIIDPDEARELNLIEDFKTFATYL
ncbi:MAG: arginine N-succinyltransferase [Bacteriovoracaceae bacterium]|nr:arginine N-succinyltransferase [Bacteriovoracaceae bacterium]